jgi:threonylcarbamoyladenosine tRNA methylthiotransferase MtaB
MTGFPGETLSDHAETLAFAREASLLHIHVFPYSERKNTVAAQMPNRLPTAEKNRRAGELIAVQNEVSNSIYAEIAREAPCLEILSEVSENGIVKGHTANFLEVCAPCDHDVPQGTLLCIRVEGYQDGALFGSVVK